MCRVEVDYYLYEYYYACAHIYLFMWLLTETIFSTGFYTITGEISMFGIKLFFINSELSRYRIFTS